jgi:hypothetical protein
MSLFIPRFRPARTARRSGSAPAPRWPLLAASTYLGASLGCLAAACSTYSDPLVPCFGPKTVCSREADTLACDRGWVAECAPGPGGCRWQTRGSSCQGEPEPWAPVVAGGACGR